MTPGVRPLVAGNWKMNGLTAALREIRTLREAVDQAAPGIAELVVCPPATLLAPAGAILQGSAIGLGAQDCHAQPSGPHTGDISAPMLKDLGCAYVIVGHSERREAHGETNADVCAKAEAALRAGLTAIVCVGETARERQAGNEIEVVGAQMRASLPAAADARALAVAYEPIWAIGTGVTPTAAQVVEMHGAIRGWLREIYGEAGVGARILYGGSVRPGNAAEFLGLANVDGALVGGASLKAADFLQIAAVYA